MKTSMKLWCVAMAGGVIVASAGCSSLKEPAATSIAVSQNAVSNASQAGGAEFAPVEMNAARHNLALSREAMTAKDYKLANELATQAQADAKLATGKASSSKAQLAANALQDDIRVLREELDRNAK